jgi:hypothetical protein
MYRQIFTPNEQTGNIQLTIPREWYGQLVEIIAFSISSINKPQQKANVKTKLSDKYRGVFSIEDAKSFDEHTRIMRSE